MLAALLSVACVESVSHPFEDFVIEVEPAKLHERCRSRRFVHSRYQWRFHQHREPSSHFVRRKAAICDDR